MAEDAIRKKLLNLGVIGLGRGFLLTLPTLLACPALRLVAAADPREEARIRFKQEFDAPAYSSVDELLRDKNVEAVYIASPHEHHAAQTIAAAKAGKHVLVEKPMAMEARDCRAMVEAARAADIVLVVGPSHGADAPVSRAASLIKSNAFGQPRMITAFNFTDFLYRPRRPEELDPSGGGVIFSQGAHQIDVVRRLANSPVATIRATTGNWDRSRPAVGAYSALLSFESGAAATLTYSGYAHYDSDELMDWISETGHPKDPQIYGRARQELQSATRSGEIAAKLARTYGNAKMDKTNAAPPYHEHFGFVLISCEKADLKLTPNGVQVYVDSERKFHSLGAPCGGRTELIDEFVQAVMEGKPALHDGLWGLTTVSCCQALLQSSLEKREISLGLPETL